MQQHASGSRWVWHTGGRDHAIAAGGGDAEGYLHEALKVWIKGHLESLGYAIVLERLADADRASTEAIRRPDLSVTSRSGNRLAIEVQLSRLPSEDAFRRTEDLQHSFDEIVWLTRHCQWVTDPDLPAIGVAVISGSDLPDQLGGTSSSNATLIGDLQVQAQEGWLVPTTTGALRARTSAEPLAAFLERYLGVGGPRLAPVIHGGLGSDL